LKTAWFVEPISVGIVNKELSMNPLLLKYGKMEILRRFIATHPYKKTWAARYVLAKLKAE
jgi:hypothetical protein